MPSYAGILNRFCLNVTLYLLLLPATCLIESMLKFKNPGWCTHPKKKPVKSIPEITDNFCRNSSELTFPY